MKKPRLASALTLLAIVAVSAAAHDDPKLQDLRSAYVGRSYRAADARRDGGPIAEVKAGMAFTSQDVTLLSWLTIGDLHPDALQANDCWGYTSPSGREYALIGTTHGTSIVEVTDPTDAQLVRYIGGPASTWRDIKTYQTYAYAVSEGGKGIQTIDLSNIDAGVVTGLGFTEAGGGSTATHNVFVDEASGYLYRCGGGSNGLRVYSLANPASPQFVASWNDRYVHDVQVMTYPNGKQVAFAFSGFNGGFNQPGVDIIDVTNKNNINLLKRVQYPGAAYCHQGWLSEDLKYLYINDEQDETALGIPTTTIVLNVQNPPNAFYLGTFTNGLPAIGHNLFTRGELVFEANYTSGLRVFDTSAGPLNATEVAFFDTNPPSNGAGFYSLWGTYPFLPSGVVLGSDMEKGLFVWWVGTPKVQFDYPAGQPETIDPAGTSVLVQLTEATSGDLQSGSARVHWDVGAGLQSAALVDLGGGLYRADLPASPCGGTMSWYVSAESTDGLVWKDPGVGGGDFFTLPVAPALTVAADEDLQVPGDWVSGAPGDDATSGAWVHGDPVGTLTQPEDDHTPGAGTNCWFTGQGQEVDGNTTLLSPVLDLSSSSNPEMSWWRWFATEGLAFSGQDQLETSLSGDGGQTWISIETMGPQHNHADSGWHKKTIRVRDFMSPTSAMQVRFTAREVGIDTTVEAAIDDFLVTDLDCPDCDGDGLSDALEIAQGGALDLDGDGVPDTCQPLSGDVGGVSVGAGGTQVLTLAAGASSGGGVYLVLGSLAGTQPGTPAGALLLPLNFDNYTVHTLTSPGQPPLATSFGTLDELGGADAAFSLLPGSPPGLVGQTAWHAYPVIDPVTGAVTFVSNAVPVQLLP